MAEKKVTMIMKVDLQCYRCYKKIKEVICKFPEIRDQRYDEKQNKVLINVVSCCPERILEKIRRKGGETVESIEIVPEKKEEPEKKKEGEKLKKAEKKKKEGDKPKEVEKTKDAPAAEKPKEGGKKKEGGGDKHKEGEKKEAQVHKLIAEPVSGVPTIYPSGMYYQPPQPYYQGYGAVPYNHGVPAYHSEGSYGVNRGYKTNRCDYFSEENPESCTVM
ncbi:heavy metal-associated isoprenylated plant protein 6-like isoform X2 [Rhodamnia argentea]|uniref:Heavy metal-associated isoprenylated plant protein 6-like isoform X1 n=1 Tax=Rhodamnia argentea TaxID=178133 RepID=A0ABM3HWF2_9MYRT|nr:heavy metal-associated isoprenylated plant protein 6-like isoform X1 [Rhodamnia argentea]XP_048140917.1 heavy metal-associated isoprenylated plant protein 6-like isoform X2 [Rhodamnia argentea]